MDWLIWGEIAGIVGTLGAGVACAWALVKLRLARKAIGKANARAHAILDGAVDGVVLIDEFGRVETFNPSAERIFGYRAAEVVGRNVKMLMPDPYRKEHDGYLSAYRTTGRPRIIGIGREVEGQRKDGSVFPMELAVGESRIGERRLFAGIVRDVSERRRSQQELKASETKMRAILETTVDGILAIDERGTLLSVNPAAERIFGYSAEEMVGRNVAILMTDPHASAHDQYLENYRRTGHRKIIGIGRTVEGRRKDGSTFPLDLAVGEAMVGGVRFFTGIVRDVTERRRFEEMLRQNEENLRLLIDNVRDYAIIWLDPDGTIATWNAGAERVYGWSALEIRGRTLAFLEPSERKADAAKALEVASETSRFETEGWRLRKDGSRFWAHVVVTPLFDDQHRMRGFVQVARDITERRRAEEALKAAKDEAERAALAKSKFLAAASHDLRQPVQALVFFASALGAKVKGTPAEGVLNNLKGSLDALNVLLDALLDVSRLDAGVVAPRVLNFSLSVLLERMATEYEALAGDKKLRIRMVPTSLVVRSDPTLLGRILQNFLSNAVRYTDFGRILVGCRRRRGLVRIEVWDTGIGIAADRLEEIFEEFYQVGNQERNRLQGLGLGLAIVQRLSRLLGHPVSVRSKPGRGSVFAVDVPLAANQRRVLARPVAMDGRMVGVVNSWPNLGPPEPVSDDAGNRTIFVIDDEAAVLQGLKMIIEEWGYRVLTAAAEAEAVDILRKHPVAPDVIIADYRLRGGKTGADAVRRIRGLYDQPIPSILITGDTAPERLREAEANGLLLLHKPVRPSELQVALAQHLNHPRAA